MLLVDDTDAAYFFLGHPVVIVFAILSISMSSVCGGRVVLWLVLVS